MILGPEFFEKIWPISGASIGQTLKTTKFGRNVTILNAVEGKFVYKVADEWKTKNALVRDLLAFDLLLQQNFKHIPNLLKTKNGESFAEADSRFIYILEYVGNKNPEPTVETYAKLGQITAQLHQIQNYQHKTDFHPGPIIAKNLISISDGLPFKEDYLQLVRSLPSFDNLPKTLIHTDISTCNAIEKESGDLILIDWDDVGMGIRLLDIAFPLIQQFISEDGDFFEEQMNAFYGAYFSNIKITYMEMEKLFPAALFIALMYINYGDTKKRWNRIQWATKNKKVLEKIVRSNF